MTHYDVVVLGAGPGGYVAAIRAAQLGLTTAIVEPKYWGGVCLNVGCIPSKALLRNAELAHIFNKEAKTFGISGEATFDFGAAFDRSRKVAEGRVAGVHFLMKKNKITELDGYGTFTGPKSMSVKLNEGGTEELTFDNPKAWAASKLPAGSIHGINKIGGHAWFMWHLRQRPEVVQMWAEYFRCDPAKLRVSFDGFGLYLAQTARRAQGKDRRPDRFDPQRERDRYQRVERVVASGRKRRPHDVVNRDRHHRRGRPRAAQVDPEGKPIGECGRRPFVLHALVQRQHHEPRCGLQAGPFAFGDDGAGIERGCDRRRHPVAQSLGHRNDDRPAISLGQQSLARDDTPGPKRRPQIEPAEKPLVVDMCGQPPDRRSRPDCRTKCDDQFVADHAAPGDHAAKPGIDRAQLQREQRIGERIGRRAAGDHAKRSATARSIRAVEPVSSSTFRRSRWRSASGATRLR